MNAAFEKTEPLAAVSSYETFVDDEARISSMLRSAAQAGAGA